MRDRLRDAGCDLEKALQLASRDDEAVQLGDGRDALTGGRGRVSSVADRPAGPDDRDRPVIAVLQQRLAVGDDDRFPEGFARRSCSRSETKHIDGTCDDRYQVSGHGSQEWFGGEVVQVVVAVSARELQHD